MPMTDPMNALRKLQAALDAGAVVLQPCVIHKELRFIHDQPNGMQRFTCALLKGEHVSAISVFVLIQPLNGLHCLQVGYAVREKDRNHGLGYKILAQGIDELTHGLSQTPMKEFYLEAVVSTSNGASNKIAQRLLSESRAEIVDSVSGDAAFQYLKRVQCVA